MTDKTFAAVAYEAKNDLERGGTVAVLVNGSVAGNIRKQHPVGDSFVYFEGADNESEPLLEESNIGALKLKLEAYLMGHAGDDHDR